MDVISKKYLTCLLAFKNMASFYLNGSRVTCSQTTLKIDNRSYFLGDYNKIVIVDGYVVRITNTEFWQISGNSIKMYPISGVTDIIKITEDCIYFMKNRRIFANETEILTDFNIRAIWYGCDCLNFVTQDGRIMQYPGDPLQCDCRSVAGCLVICQPDCDVIVLPSGSVAYVECLRGFIITNIWVVGMFVFVSFADAPTKKILIARNETRYATA